MKKENRTKPNQPTNKPTIFMSLNLLREYETAIIMLLICCVASVVDSDKGSLGNVAVAEAHIHKF